MRKYGIENFTYEVIEDNIPSIEDRAEIERDNIIKFESLVTQHGYNQTLCTDCAFRDSRYRRQEGKHCALVDKNNNVLKKYISLHEAARDNNIGNNSITTITDICNGIINSNNDKIFRWLDEKDNIIIPQQQTRSRRVAICAINVRKPDNIVYFKSVSSAARQLNIERSSIIKCLAGRKKYSIVGENVFRYIDNNNNIIENEIPIQDALSRYICINGIGKTFTEWADYLKITTNSMYAYMKAKQLTKKEVIEHYLKKRGDAL